MISMIPSSYRSAFLASGRVAYRQSWKCRTGTRQPRIIKRHSSNLTDVGTLMEPISTTPSPGIVAAALIGLPLALWTYKCMMMVVFQRKIIYMGYIPPGSRTEVLSDCDPDLRGLVKEDVEVESEEGVMLRGYVFRRQDTSPAKPHRKAIIVYFQGNVGSPIQRLPLFQKLLRHPLLRASPPTSLEIIAIPPRSFGRSTNRSPSQRALLRDYESITRYATARAETEGAAVIWMGHSLGSSIATLLLAQQPFGTHCDALVFENGFASIPEMVRALYPSKWLPYHYLGALAFDTWDARGVFEMAGKDEGQGAGSLIRDVPILFVSSDDDELVPPEMMRGIYSAALQSRGGNADDTAGRGVRWVEVKGGLHDFGWKKEVWGKSVVQFIRDIVDRQAEKGDRC